MTARPKVAETDVARPVVAWLRDQHWDVHQEVAPGGGGSARADIVGAQGRVLYVIEVKVAFSIAVVEQAMGWAGKAHYVSVAVPQWTLHGSGRRVLDFACRHFGIGVLGVDGLDARHGEQPRVMVDVKPRLNRRPHDMWLRKALCDETRNNDEAGAKLARYSTPFSRTCAGIGRLLAGSGEPMTTRELVAAISHHYSTDSSARSCLPAWLRAGKVPGVVAVPGAPERWGWDAAAYQTGQRKRA